GSGSETVYDSQPFPGTQSAPVSRASALWQLLRATSANDVDVDLTYYPSFGDFFINRIGPNTLSGAGWWQYRVNYVAPPVGAMQRTLVGGDSVVWFASTGMGTGLLEATPNGDRIARGQSFTVRVNAHAANGTASPAAGASVTYGQAQGTTDAAGNVTFIAQGNGVQGVRAERAGDVRSATRGVCSFDADPTICNLPPAPVTPPPAERPSTLTPDTVAPGSMIQAPVLGATLPTVRRIGGTAGPDRSDVAGVEVSAGLRVGTLCRFRTVTGSLTTARSCAQPQWLTARLSGGNWVLPLGKRPLTPGTWRLETRATDGAGNVESIRVPGVNIGAVRVRGPIVSPVTRIAAPRAGARSAKVRTVRGTAGPASADIALVQVSLAKRTAAGCRFVTANGRLGGVRGCAARILVPAQSRGATWTLPLRSPLTPGRWVATARARNADGIVGPPATATFTVTGAAR
ncbi:MAG TPA: hypothetical protein PKE32_08315, partial [Miltoncostaeaceae bacterium]|nr:hypothetical protein [Miltoncostaeaceae bacterium]